MTINSLAQLRDRLATPRHVRQPFGDHLLNPGFEDWIVSRAKRDAAVLIPVIDRPDAPQVLLTKRNPALRAHAGQVAFPGGRIDQTDANPIATALRETHEEIGITPQSVEIIGQLPQYFTGSGYRVYPVVGYLPDDVSYSLNPDEVDEVFEVPLTFLSDQTNIVPDSFIFKGERRHYYTIPTEPYPIWGVTAGMIRLLLERTGLWTD